MFAVFLQTLIYATESTTLHRGKIFVKLGSNIRKTPIISNDRGMVRCELLQLRF
jgi:hypothetical protein